ncbi:hypothetical protein A3I53_02180 [Candidatus Curtissbacteria bacterium RIFCSPLOWO2_02_FULL_40_13b]|uniref:PIN domain-containing protein n=1 Tax=Candidatus Curtissbacteria bacterium RIFCSPLOWO2_02_FULL_40_13b TaxID=1797733 RepID=A0A1F5HUL9_9BACT|nr:MAG: hypothetical protein A3I53_02180 [Candidatus Curtissbacteria bacterium RIFCSPLOWO2_02_FULL_40_13b]
MTRLITDTNVFLRFLLNDNTQQYKQATNIFRKAKEKKIELIVPQIIIFEICFALEKYYQLSKEQVIEKLKAIVSADYFQVQDREVFNTTLGLYKMKNASFVDCFLISQAKMKGSELFTFDKDLPKLV